MKHAPVTSIKIPTLCHSVAQRDFGSEQVAHDRILGPDIGERDAPGYNSPYRTDRKVCHAFDPFTNKAAGKALGDSQRRKKLAVEQAFHDGAALLNRVTR